ncbi:MAG: PKD domain-containing protein [Methanomicrobiales archaeon]|nr:PKD domain-containing protein [Methanomicrobiales archaeon]
MKFTDLSTGNPTSWAWDFGDGASSTEQNPTHVYKLEGSYDVTLTVTNSYGSDTIKKTASATDCVNGATGYITVGRSPAADFLGVPVSGKEPLTVAFTDKSLGSNIRTYLWNFGDGSTSTDTNPSHTYTAVGAYTVTQTVTNVFGTDTATKAEYIHVGIGPNAEFVGTPQTGNLPLAVTFTDMSTGNPATWSWNFGDGGASAAQNPSHTYSKAGVYSVSLTVTNSFGRDTETKSAYINTGMPPTADFTSTTRAGIIPLSVKFTDTSKGAPTSWAWDFGDGATSTERHPTHVYTSAGTYSVTLTAKNAYGSDSETKAGFVTAGGKPKADFTADQRVGIKPFTVKFTDLSTGNPTSWSWDLGDGSKSAEQNPVHVYQKEGAYDVTLTVSNSYGTDTVKKTGTSNGGIYVPPATGTTVSVTAAATTAQATTAVPQGTQTPGFEGILAVTGLAALVFLAKRR